MRRRNVLKGIGGAALAAGFAGIGPAAPTYAQAKKNLNIRAGSAYGPNSHYVAVFQKYFMPEFTKRAAAEADTAVTFTEAFSGSVAKPPEVLDFVRNGTFQLGMLSTPFTPSKTYIQNFPFFLPFTHPKPLGSSKIVSQIYQEFPELQDDFKKHGQRAVALIGLADYGIITKFPWETVDDLKGKKIGGAGSNLRWLEGTGVVPVTSALGEAYTNMQTGVIDGYLIHIAGMYAYKLFEVAPFIRQVHFGSPVVTMLTANEQFYQGLDEEQQKVLDEVSLEYQSRANEAVEKEADDAIAALTKAGATVSSIDEDSRKRWATSIAHVPVESAAEAAKRGTPIDKILLRYAELNKDAGYPFPAELRF
jgi:TRAP-type C4-dicarboxylate transport system substrate-binding protein